MRHSARTSHTGGCQVKPPCAPIPAAPHERRAGAPALRDSAGRRSAGMLIRSVEISVTSGSGTGTTYRDKPGGSSVQLGNLGWGVYRQQRA